MNWDSREGDERILPFYFIILYGHILLRRDSVTGAIMLERVSLKSACHRMTKK